MIIKLNSFYVLVTGLGLKTINTKLSLWNTASKINLGLERLSLKYKSWANVAEDKTLGRIAWGL